MSSTLKILQPCGAGRPVSIKDSEIKALEICFATGCTVSEALAVTNVSRDAYYRLLRRQPEFRDRFSQLQQKPLLQAKKVIADKIASGCVETSKWYLEKRDPEFSGSKIKVKEPPSTPETMSEAEVEHALMRLVKPASG